ncbi:hypothetical protein HanIR_Chr12g0614811 [Helianthus annuus]|nr:hypothetical protein HanIR_Chr12g0614811 [Helianthus annuus]
MVSGMKSFSHSRNAAGSSPSFNYFILSIQLLNKFHISSSTKWNMDSVELCTHQTLYKYRIINFFFVLMLVRVCEDGDDKTNIILRIYMFILRINSILSYLLSLFKIDKGFCYLKIKFDYVTR